MVSQCLMMLKSFPALAVLAAGSRATPATSQVSNPARWPRKNIKTKSKLTSTLRAGTQAQPTAAPVQATTPAAPASPTLNGRRASHREPGPHTSQQGPTEGHTTSPHLHAPQGPLYSTPQLLGPPSLAREEARGLRFPSSPLMLSLGVLELIIKGEDTTRGAARVDLIVAHQV